MPTIGGNIGTPSGGFWLGVDFYYSQNTEGNYSTITSIVSKVTKNNSSYKPYNLTGKTATLKVEYLNESGSWVTAANLSDSSGYDMRSASTITLVSGSNIKIPHKSNGKQTVRITAYVNGNLSNYYPNGTVTSSVDLTDIPRATTPSLDPVTVEMGKSIAISLPRAVSTFTHTLQHDFYAGSWTTFAEGVGTSATLSVPTSWASRIPTLESGAGRIRCLTYSGSTLIGEKIVDFTATVPSTVIPTVDKITITEAVDGLASKFGAFIQNKSQLRVVSSASGAGGSTISSYEVEVLGVTYKGQDITTYTLTQNGTIDVKVTVTDSRGRKGSKTAQVSVVEYFTPTILSFDAFRSNSDGNENTGSKILKCVYNFKVAPCGNKNDASYKLEYRKAGASTWTALKSGSSYAENTSFLKKGAVELEYSYEARLTVSDYFSTNNPTTYLVKVGSEIVVFCPHPTGKGLGILGYPTREAFQVFGESEFWKDAIFKSNRYVQEHYGGTSGTDGYVALVKITIKGNNVNAPFAFEFSQRDMSTFTKIFVRFKNVSNTDPDLNSILFLGQIKGVYIAKTDTSTWKIYVKKTGVNDFVTVSDFLTSTYNFERAGVEFINEFVTELPMGYTTATRADTKNNLTTTASGWALDARQGKALNDKITDVIDNLVITVIDYSMTLSSNAYVSPYSYYGNFTIPAADITSYGTPVSVTAQGNAGAAVPVSFVTDHQYVTAVNTSASVTLHVTFIKLK